MSLPFLNLPTRWYGPGQNTLNEPNIDEMTPIIKWVIDTQSEDVCEAMRVLAEARGIYMNKQNWSAACHAIGITNEFKQQYPEYSSMKWRELFALFCHDESNDGPRKRSVYYRALKTNQFYNACLLLRTEVEQGILTRLLTFHTAGRYVWHNEEYWQGRDRAISNCLDFRTMAGDEALNAFRVRISELGVDVNCNLGGTFVNVPEYESGGFMASTALVYSIGTGNDDLFDLVLSHPTVDVNKLSNFTHPIYWAFDLKRVEMAKKLLDRGADLVSYGLFKNAKGLGDAELVEKVMAQMSRHDYAHYFIIFAMLPKDELFVGALRLLIDPADIINRFNLSVPTRPMDLNVRFKNDRTLLMTAAEENAPAVTMWLIQNGAEKDLQDKNGNTAMHIAIMKGHAYIFDILMDQGASPWPANNNGKSPYKLALRSRNEEILRVLAAY